nr:Coenzyme F420 hydrogenase/dehydrogenase, beta subunit C-terminal domain [Salsipaludibacter albus]
MYHEVVDTGLCTGCAACVMACPRDVLGYTEDYFPVQVGEGHAFDQCTIGDRGCDICTRACPRFRNWESDLDEVLFGRPRDRDEVYGQVRSILLTRATDTAVHEQGQDGGLVSTLLIWGLEQEMIDGALTSAIVDTRGPFDSEPALVTDRDGVLATAGSRYTYSANPLAMADAEQAGLKNIALVGMSCQASIGGTVEAYGVNKYKRKIALTIGLLCSKTFTYDGQKQVLAEHGIDIADVVKVNIKGRYMVWLRDGTYEELPLKLFHPHTRPGCKLCPDFAAEHADIATGGIGADDDWTLTLVRTERGEEWMRGVIDAGLVEARPGEDDPVAMNLLTRLSTVSRKRWPTDAVPADARTPGLLPLAD